MKDKNLPNDIKNKSLNELTEMVCLKTFGIIIRATLYLLNEQYAFKAPHHQFITARRP